MKYIFINFSIALLTLIANQSYSQQYNKKQIDSILEAARLLSNVEQGIKLGTIGYNASKAINYQEGIVKALLLYSSKSVIANRFEDVFKYAVEAENEASKLNNYDLETYAVYLKGVSYTRLGFSADGKKALLDAISIAQHIEDADQRHIRLYVIYNALVEHSGNAQAIILYKRSYSEFNKVRKHTKGLGKLELVENNLGYAYFKIKQYDSAKFYFNKALVLAKAEKDTFIMASTCQNLGEFYYAKKQYAASEQFYKQSISIGHKTRSAAALKNNYLGLSKVYAALNKNKEAEKYLEQSVRLADSLAVIDKSSVKTPLSYIVKNKEQQLAANRSQYLNIVMLTCFVLTFTIVCGLYFYQKYRIKLKLNRTQINELVAKIELAEDKQSSTKIEELKAVVQLAVSNDPAFITKFNEYDPEFSKKLVKMAQGLVAAEIEFCAMLRLNFETKEIARYSRTSVRAVEAKKHRIRKKLRIPSDQDINIWMSHI